MLGIDCRNWDQYLSWGAKLKNLSSKEFFYLKMSHPHELNGVAAIFLEEAMRRSSECFLSVPVSMTKKMDWLPPLRKKGLKGLYVQIQPTNEELEIFLNLKKLLGDEMELRPDFVLSGNLIALGPMIRKLSKLGHRSFVLGCEGFPNHIFHGPFRDAFDHLRIHSVIQIDILFNPANPRRLMWEMQSLNPFSGPRDVHIDISNKCTHSCEFCALYGRDGIELMKKHGLGKLQANVIEFMSSQIDAERCLQFIHDLPPSVKLIQFGGAGDPMTHPSAIEFITLARNKGIQVEILSNMEYLDKEKIQTLHELGSADKDSLHFVSNISGSTATKYIETRPRQTAQTFSKVIQNLKDITELRERDKKGVTFKIMSVMNRINYLEGPGLIRLAKEVGADAVWLKPMEVHHRPHQRLLIEKKQMKSFVNSLKETFKLSDELEIPLFDSEVLQLIMDKGVI